MNNYSVTLEVAEIGAIDFGPGNITPNEWYQNLKHDNGKANLPAITILSEIVWWYKPRVERNEETGMTSGRFRKFKADKLQITYQALANKFGISKRQANDACKFLRDRGLITLELRNLTTPSGIRMNNVLFIGVNPERITELSGSPIIKSQRDTYHDRTGEGSLYNGGGTTFNRGTNTEITTEITTDIDLERKQDSNPNSSSVSKQKEEYLLTCQFEEFWKLAAKKVSKGQARKAFKSALKKTDFQTLISSWTRRCREDKQKIREGEGQYVKHPSTWLNGECWADEPPDGTSSEPEFREYTDASGYTITATGYREPGSSIEYHGRPPNTPAVRGSLEKPPSADVKPDYRTPFSKGFEEFKARRKANKNIRGPIDDRYQG